jgi:hypothetical protein
MAAYVGHSVSPTAIVPDLNEQHLLFEKGITSQELSVDILPTRVSGINATVYRQSCASYVNAKAGGGVALPLVAIQSALDAQLSTGGRASVSTGFFQSPFADMINGGGARAHYARLLVWERYSQSPELLTGPNYILKGFKGAVLLGAIADSSSTKMDIGASAGGTAGPASGRVSVDTRFDGTTEYRSEEFKTLVPRVDSTAFQKLEEPVAIKTYFEGVYTATRFEPPSPLLSGQNHEHRFTIAGITKGLCEGGWNVSGVVPAIYESTPTAVGIASVDTAERLPQCTFVVGGRPSDAVVVAATPPAIKYTLTSKLRLDMPGGQRLSLAFTPSDIQLKANPNPQWIPIFASLVPKPDPSGTSVRWFWEVPFDLKDSGNPVDRQLGIQVETGLLKCPISSRTIPVTAGVKRDEITQQYTLIIRTQNTFVPPASGLRTEACTLLTTLKFPLVHGTAGLVPRQRDLTVDMPVVEAPPAQPSTPQDIADFVQRLNTESLFIETTRQR